MFQTTAEERVEKSASMSFVLLTHCYYLIVYSIFAAFPSSASASLLNEGHQNHFIYRKSSLGILSGMLRTYQRAACDESWMTLTCPETTTISVQFAQYGTTKNSRTLCQSLSSSDLPHPYKSFENNLTCYSQKAMQSVVTRCQKKSECQFQVTPKAFGGDPCLHLSSSKFAEVAYKCRPSEFKSVTGCENDVVQLTCNPGSRLAIYSAIYGYSGESLLCPQPHPNDIIGENTCLSSFSSEITTTLCQGRRRCSIKAGSETFGKPCKQSKLYLKLSVIYTCVPKQVLKRKFRGELESDESEDADDDETNDYDSTFGIIEPSSIPSSNHPLSSHSSVSKNSHSTQQGSESQVFFNSNSGDEEDNFARSSAVLNSDEDIHQLDANHNHTQTSEDIRFINLITQSINAYSFFERHSQAFWLLIVISMLSVFLLLLFLLLIRLICLRHKRRKGKEEQRKKSSTIRRSSGLSDIDELSLVMDPNEYIQMSTIQRRNNPSLYTAGSGLAKNKVVRYSNSRASTLGRQESETSPRSFHHQENESDIHFFFG